MGVDALWIVPDKSAAAREVARSLRPRARFVFTTWDVEVTPPGWPPQVNDHHSLLQDAGFAVEAYEETSGWEQHQRAVYGNVRTAQADLSAEMGEVAAGALLAEANLLPGLADGTDYLAHMRRILVAARKASVFNLGASPDTQSNHSMQPTRNRYAVPAADPEALDTLAGLLFDKRELLV